MVASGPRIHCLESDDRRQLMTLGQAFFLCEDEVGGPGGVREKASQSLYKCAQGQERPLVCSRAASGDKAAMMSPHG